MGGGGLTPGEAGLFGESAGLLPRGREALRGGLVGPVCRLGGRMRLSLPQGAPPQLPESTGTPEGGVARPRRAQMLGL